MKRITFTTLFVFMSLLLSTGLSRAQSTDATLSDINIDIGVLTPAFNPDITKYVVLVPDGTEAVTVSPLANEGSASFSGGGVISLANQELTTITVTAEDGTTKKSYHVFMAHENCYAALFNDRVNLAPNPLMTALSGFYGGWGARSINTDPGFVFCGNTSAKITGAGGGSIDFNTVANYLEPGAFYQISAMFYVEGSGKAQIGHSINGTSVLTETTKTNEWEQVSTVVEVTSLNNSANLWLNNWQIGVAGDNVYVDNFQMYKIDNDDNLSELTFDVGTLVPVFDPEVTDYYLLINEGTTAVNIQAVASSATSLVSGDGNVTLINDKGTAEVVVTAESGNSKTYTIHITTELPDMDATLSELSVDAGTLSPVFDPEVTFYTWRCRKELQKSWLQLRPTLPQPLFPALEALILCTTKRLLILL